MINFHCPCGEPLSFPEESAGDSIQCPTCKRLVDIPTLDETLEFDSDGMFKLGDENARPDRNDDDLVRIFARRNQDRDGQDFDLRTTFQQIQDAGVDEIPLASEDGIKPAAPKYDPVTGELIKPMTVAPIVQKPPISVGASSRALSYATGSTDGEVPARRVPIELLRPSNLLVIGIVFAIQMLHQLIVVVMAAGMVFAAVISILFIMMLVAHFTNVVDEIGPTDRDELPAVGRSLGWTDDIWHPFVQLAGSLIICYAPVFILLRVVDAPLVGLGVALPFLAVGTFLFPAVYLTLATSGTVLNLRPDRIWNVVRACGPSYLLVVLLWVVAAVSYSVSSGFAVVHAATLVLFGGGPLPIPAPIIYAGVIVGLYFMHLFCWSVGLLYRNHYAKFPWVLQRHERDPRKQVRPVQRKRQPAGRPQAAAQQAIPVRPLKAVPVQPIRAIPVEPIPSPRRPQ